MMQRHPILAKELAVGQLGVCSLAYLGPRLIFVKDVEAVGIKVGKLAAIECDPREKARIDPHPNGRSKEG